MRILVVGAGATGGYFGGRAAAAGADVTFFVRPQRARALAQAGLTIISPALGDLHISPRTVSGETLGSGYAAVILAVKAHGFDKLLEELAPAIGPETVILPMLNGMAHVDRLIARFGAGCVLGGVCHIGATLDDEGRVIHLGASHDIVLGELDGALSARAQALAAALRAPGARIDLSSSILQAMWDKWIALGALAVLTCLMRANVGELARTPWGGMLADHVIAECAAIAAAHGHAAHPALLADLRDQLTSQGSQQTCSLYRDLLRGRRTESATVLGDFWARGAWKGIEAPLLAAATAQLAVHDARVRATCGETH